MLLRWVVAVGFVTGALGFTTAEKVDQHAPIPIPTTLITVKSDEPVKATLDAFQRAGLKVDAAVVPVEPFNQFELKNAPFWSAVEAVAEATGSRIELSDQGRKIALVKRGEGKDVSCVRGPFRVAVRQVNGRLDLASGNSFQELELLVHWEPRFPVFRIDSVPAITTAKDDLGNSLTAASASAMSPVNGASSHVLPVRLLKVPRKAGAIAELAGQFTVTASERMLPFRFANLGGKLPQDGVLPAGVDAGKVKAALTDWSAIRIGGAMYWEATLRLSYPPGMPEFQSFETWLGENKIRLITPQGAALAPDQVEEPSPGREMTVVYRFNTAKIGANPNGAGWSLVYDTPAPLVEFRVPFELRNVPLP